MASNQTDKPEYVTKDLSEMESDQQASPKKPKSLKTFFGQIWDYLVLKVIHFMSIIGFTIFIIALTAYPIAMIVIGFKYLRSCPAQPFIPIYLIGMGCARITNILLILVQISKAKESKIVKVLPVVILPVSSAWFLGGMRSVSFIDNKFSSDPEADNFCDSFLYSFAFWLPYANIVLLGVICVSTLCLVEYLNKKS